MWSSMNIGNAHMLEHCLSFYLWMFFLVVHLLSIMSIVSPSGGFKTL